VQSVLPPDDYGTLGNTILIQSKFLPEYFSDASHTDHTSTEGRHAAASGVMWLTFLHFYPRDGRAGLRGAQLTWSIPAR